MFFNITADHGDLVAGYFVPDSFSAPSVIRIMHRGGEPILFEADGTIPELVAIGRHATGKCAFKFDGSLVPNLVELSDLEIQDPDTGLRLYRRRSPEPAIKAKIFRLETHLAPLSHLDDVLERHFQFSYKSIEQLGRETAIQILELFNADSTYASGRLLLKTYEYLLYNGFQTICLFHDPFDELAERLLVLKQFGRTEAGLLDVRDSMMFESAIEFVATLDLSDDKQLRRAFRGISLEDAAILADPLVRALTARTLDETAQDDSLASALDVLSNFAVVGLREYQDLFLESLAALLGVDVAGLPAITQSPAVTELGRTLREIGIVRTLIERDLELYNQVRAALEKAL